MKSQSLAALLHAFFHEWMGKQRNLSRHTVCSYRDTWKLFLRFASERKRREVAELSLTDLDAGEVLVFLEHLEKDRKVSLGTRNCRLAAIHSFFTFVCARDPWRSRSATRSRAFRSRRCTVPPCAIWMPRRSPQSCGSPTAQAWKGKGITLCSPSSTTRVHESRSYW